MKSDYDKIADELKLPNFETGDEKEVYSFLGLAIFEAVGLERWVVQLLTMEEMDVAVQPSMEMYDEVYAKYAEYTLGRLLTACEKCGVLNADLVAKLRQALPVRNQIVHRVAWDSAELFCTSEGRRRLIRDFRRDIALLTMTSIEVGKIVTTRGQVLGVTSEQVSDMMAQMLKESTSEEDNA